MIVRHALAYGAALAGLAFLVDWLAWQHALRFLPTDGYIVVVAVVFAAIGLWLGRQLVPLPRGPGFVRNQRALDSLGISRREAEVLDLLAAGQSNKLIARALGISPNTVKTHLARLFAKLEVESRTQAIRKARELELVP